jgi:hypothetical protein
MDPAMTGTRKPTLDLWTVLGAIGGTIAALALLAYFS